ncbi:hypothetical protein H2201_007323 [Coniosporium apollinis]|uniref:DUF676 domain-containing protein n=1 Tax=Coniosporium apollinis TaxID=61459 RepID=A0ABQ9NMU4_9PEZI|nr:hypothetical protein H2201_007323 [Coniosporium apollinis]
MAHSNASDPDLQSGPPVEVFDEGFTELWTPPKAVADIIFVHGLQGHPRSTWTHGTWNDPDKPPSKISKLFGRKVSSTEAANESTCFWPADILPKDAPSCRIAVYGYDSRISNFFSGPASQVNIVGHGMSLLNALEALRRDSPERPIIFVVHSLGGLILKEALRRSWQAQSYEQDLRTVYDATAAIVFMGTPHRGSQYADWGIILRNIAAASGFDTNDRNLRDLKIDSPVLEILREEFSKMMKEEKFDVYTLMESKSFKGIGGLNGKVVDDVSSTLNDARERRHYINANHVEMCRFSGPKDPGYRIVKDVLFRCLNSKHTSTTPTTTP